MSPTPVSTTPRSLETRLTRLPVLCGRLVSCVFGSCANNDIQQQDSPLERNLFSCEHYPSIFFPLLHGLDIPSSVEFDFPYQPLLDRRIPKPPHYSTYLSEFDNSLPIMTVFIASL